MSDLIREALENLVRQQDGHPRSLEKLRRQGLSPDHPTVTATMEGHRLMMDKAWQQAREAIARTPYPSTRQQEVGSGRVLPHPGSPEASAMLDSLLAEYQWPANSKNAARAGWEAANRWLAAAPSTPEKAGGVSDGVDAPGEGQR